MAVSWLIIDSGWGGLNFAARLFQQIRDKNNGVQLIFANVQPSASISYHRLPDEAARIAHLEADLLGLEKTFRPERIIIACNTLSVLFGKSGRTAGTAVELNTSFNTGYLRQLQKEYQKILLVATPITVGSGYYQQHCPGLESLSMPGLAGSIEDFGEGGETALLISEGLRNRLENSTNLPNAIFLGCTHFGYVQHLFEKTACEIGAAVIPVINPDLRFADEAAAETYFYGQPAQIRISARFRPPQNVLNNLLHFLGKAEPAVTNALKTIEITY
jgi:glutamate racemase